MTNPALSRLVAPYDVARYRALSTEIVLVTPEIAKKLRLSCHFERQRALSTDHIRRLASEMRNGWFLPGTPIWFCDLPDGKSVIVNGNHTLEAVAESGLTVPLTFVHQRVRDIDEAAWAYSCFDIQKSRTWMQAAQAHGLGDTIPMLQWALPAMAYILAEFRQPSGLSSSNPLLSSRHERFDAVKSYTGALALLHGLLPGVPVKTQALLHRAAVMSIAMVTARYQPASAEEFWSGLLKDDGLRVGDPRKALLRYLSLRSAVVGRHELMVGAAQAWNAFFEDRLMQIVKPGQMHKFRILGTPWEKSISLPKSRSAVAVETESRVAA